MKQAIQIELVRRALAHLEARSTDTSGVMRPQTAAAYADPARFERERARLFRDYPIAIGHASQLAKPGDFITHEASGVPLLVTRGEDGQVRAFVNVCRHRGTRVVSAACGSSGTFTCPYHAWTYDACGELVGVPHEAGFVGAGELVRGKRNLTQVPVAELAGLIFVVPGGDRSHLASWLGPLEDDLRGFGVEAGHAYAPMAMSRPLSWKLAIDVFLEAYHLKTAHKNSIYPMFFDNVGLVDPVGPHLRNVFPKRTIKELASTQPESWQLRRHANVLFHLFPNTLVLVEPDHAAVLHLWPEGPGSTLLTAYMLVPEQPATDKARAYWDANDKILMSAVAEDFAMGESIQRGVAAAGDFMFGAFEHALGHFHDQIAQLTTRSG
jgi:phenylpropionate dioxygenase-like ring-hydroxylating dioxygenase large terminal subunit